MFLPPISEAEIQYRQRQVQTGFIASQRQITIAGMRQVLGNSVIAMGNRIHGMAAGSCQDAAETSNHIRTVLRTRKPVPMTQI